MQLLLPQDHIGGTVDLHLMGVLWREEHVVTYLHVTGLGTGAEDFRPDEAGGHLRRGRNYYSPRAVAFGVLIGTHQHAVVQHHDRQFAGRQVRHEDLVYALARRSRATHRPAAAAARNGVGSSARLRPIVESRTGAVSSASTSPSTGSRAIRWRSANTPACSLTSRPNSPASSGTTTVIGSWVRRA